MIDLRAIARAMNGDVRRSYRTGELYVVAPGPDHSTSDRSLAVSLSKKSADGFVVFSFAGDDWRVCRDYVCEKLGISRWRDRERIGTSKFDGEGPSPPDFERAVDQYDCALRIWNSSHHPRNTIVVNYLLSRGLTLPEEVAGDVIRFHPALKFNGARVGGMVCLFRDVRTNEPCGIHRTFLDCSGRKLGRKMLGRARGAAIKLDADENVTLGLHIGEGVETCLAARLAGFRPVWALGSASAIASFPVLPGIEAVTVLGETADGGANSRAAQQCAAKWISAQQEAFIVVPLVGDDLNAVWREVA